MERFEENEKLFDPMMNILLVKYGVRPGALIETFNWGGMTKEEIALVKKKAKQEGLVVTQDLVSKKRFFITKEKIKPPETDEEIAILLGFYAIDSFFSDENSERIGVSITETKTDTQIVTQVYRTEYINEVNMRNFMSKTVDNFDSVMRHLGLPYRFKAEFSYIIPTTTLVKNVDDKEYVENHLYEYANLMYNNVAENDVFVEDDSLILSHYSAFRFLFHLAAEGFFDQLVEKYPSVKEAEKDFVSFEKKILKASPSRFSALLKKHFSPSQ